MNYNQDTQQFGLPNTIVVGTQAVTIPNEALHQHHNGQPIIIQLQTNTVDYNKYPSKAAIGFGIAQIVIGLLCIMFGILTVTVDEFQSWLSMVRHGIWCGVMFTIAGSFTVAAGGHKNPCLIITSMVLSIIAAVFVVGIVVTSSVTIAVIAMNDIVHDYQGGVAAEGMLLALACFELLIAILSAVLGCCTLQKQVNPGGQTQIVYLPSAALSSMQTAPGYPPNYNDAVQMAQGQPTVPTSYTTQYSNNVDKQPLV